MHVFIDESGTFSATSKPSSVSAVGALVIPDAKLPYFEKLFAKLRVTLPTQNGEVKGRLLTEAHVRSVVDLLLRVGSFFEVVIVDLGLHTQEQLDRHKQGQAEAVTAHLTDAHHPELVAEVWKLRQYLEAMPSQLYVQSVAQSELIYDVLNHAQIFFAVRRWRELGIFHWVIDAKGKGRIVPWEHWWRQALLPMLESKTFRRPFSLVREGNYRAMERFKTTPTDYKRQFTNGEEGDGEWTDLRLVMTESMHFCDRSVAGLEAVDILVNSIRRSLAGNFSRVGWLPIREIMINRRASALKLIALAGTDLDASSLPYASIVSDFTRCGISMFP